jgi:uncharacterized protein with von Willebrand factor type A (vWA) domain
MLGTRKRATGRIPVWAIAPAYSPTPKTILVGDANESRSDVHCDVLVTLESRE